MEFVPSVPFTVGVELEVQLVDSFTKELTEVSSVVFEKASPSLLKILHKEFLQSMVEVVSPPCKNSKEAVSCIERGVVEIKEIGEKEGFKPFLLGTHPFADPWEIRITNDDRYKRLLEEFQVVLKNFLIFGLHIHVGVSKEQDLWKAFNSVLKYMPLFVALTSSSPFYKGKFTGLHSYRLKVFEQLPRAGVPESFSSLEEFNDMYNILKMTGFVKSLKDVWWDVRPRPDLGTIELRVCDATPDFKRIEAVADFMRLIVAGSLDKNEKPLYHQVVRQNRWNAVRHGLDGLFIDYSGVENINSKIHGLLSEFEKEGLMEELGIDSSNLYTVFSNFPVSYKMIKDFKKGESLRKIADYGFIK